MAKERDARLKELIVKVPKVADEGGKDDDDVFRLRRLESDVNTWHIIKEVPEGEEEEVAGIALTYVDDILVATESRIAEAYVKAFDALWTCSPEDVVKVGSKGHQQVISFSKDPM